MVERVEQPRPAHIGEAQYGQRADMLVTKSWLKPASNWRIGQNSIKIHWRLRNRDAVAFGRYRTVEVGQRFLIIKHLDFGHEGRKQIKAARGLRHELL